MAPPLAPPATTNEQKNYLVGSLGCISILILAVQVWCDLHAAGHIVGAMTRDTHTVKDIFFFVFAFYLFRKPCKVVESTKNVLDTWFRSLLLWFTKLADRVTLSMYLNSAISKDTAAPAQCRGVHYRKDPEAQLHVRMTVEAKWNAIVKSREVGLGVGSYLEAHRNPADHTSPYGSSQHVAEPWLKKLNKMYIEAANTFLAHGV